MKITVLDKGFIELIDMMGNDGDVVRAARVSYDGGERKAAAFTSKDVGLLKFLYTHKHLTPFEMVVLKFRVKLPIFVARQWMRHRTFSYNEISGRYVKLEQHYYVPDKLRSNIKGNKQVSIISQNSPEQEAKLLSEIDSICIMCFEKYDLLIKSGVARELARAVLPLGTYTQMIVKCDLRNLLNFVELRLADGAQYEIRAYAEAIVNIIKKKLPEVYKIAFG